MSDYNLYDFSIKSEADLLRMIKEARQFGLSPMVIINGMYYSVDYKVEKGENNVRGYCYEDLF